MIGKTLVEDVLSNKERLFMDSKESFANTRDIFTARLQSYIHDTEKYLEAAVIGEIGNNSFDHNFGYISQYPGGVYCNVMYEGHYIVLADYGKGVRKSLLNVLKEIPSDKEAVEIAFTKMISGRAPEQRGNGLKFVSEVIQEHDWSLFFQSGVGSCSINKKGLIFTEEAVSTTGCLAIINFNGA